MKLDMNILVKKRNINQNSVLDIDDFSRNNNIISQKHLGVSLKPQLFDDSEDVDEYFAQLEILAEINDWDYRYIWREA